MVCSLQVGIKREYSGNIIIISTINNRGEGILEDLFSQSPQTTTARPRLDALIGSVWLVSFSISSVIELTSSLEHLCVFFITVIINLAELLFFVQLLTQFCQRKPSC